MNKLYQETQQSNSFMNSLNQLMQNPKQFLMQRKMNIPEQYYNNPQEAVNYLVQSGQVNQDTLNIAMQLAQKMGIKL
jgi:Tfp pilus assembly protein PilF